jgi:hypothetical protein
MEKPRKTVKKGCKNRKNIEISYKNKANLYNKLRKKLIIIYIERQMMLTDIKSIPNKM